MGVILSSTAIGTNFKERISKRKTAKKTPSQQTSATASTYAKPQITDTHPLKINTNVGPSTNIREESIPPQSQNAGIDQRAQAIELSAHPEAAQSTSQVIKYRGADGDRTQVVLNPQSPTTGGRADAMATDEEYMDFLNKANEDPNPPAAASTSGGGGKIALKSVDGEIPVGLRSVVEGGKDEMFYESDADEVFVGVSLNLGKGKLPDEGTFAKLVQHPSPQQADISILDIQEWDPRGHYKKIVDQVREAVQGSDVRVYRVGLGGVRVEYWVVGVLDGRLVGAKALAIES